MGVAEWNSLMCPINENKNRKWCFIFKELKDIIVCYNKTITSTSGLWRAENPFTSTLPEFVMQLVLILLFNRVLMLIFKPLHLSRISAEILGGILLGQSLIADTKIGKEVIFPFRSVVLLETVGNFSLVYYMFLVGLEIDIKPVTRAGSKALTIALVGLLLPLPVGAALYFHIIEYQKKFIQKDSPQYYGFIFWSVVLATTNFPDLARILADLKLLYSDVGRTALSSAVITDLFSWVLLVISMIVINPDKLFIRIPLIISFIVFFLIVVRPILAWIIHRTSKDDNYTEGHVCFVLAGVAICGYMTDFIGSHSILGAFMFGVAMPKGELKNMLIEKIEDFVSGLLMPIFFLIVGLRTNYMIVGKFGIGIPKLIVIILACIVTKIISVFMAAFFITKMTFKDSMALGLLMNTKGLLSLIILGLGRDMRALDIQKYGIMMITIWIMTTMVGPIMFFTYKGVKPIVQYKRRTIRSIGQYNEFPILVCLHSIRNAIGFINLIETSNPTKQSPISVFAVQLVELVGRAQAMLIVHDTCKANTNEENILEPTSPSGSNHFASSFNDLKSRSEAIFIEHLTAVSSYSSMHEDICTLAEEKQIALILLPFHKQSMVEEGVDNENSPFRAVNKNVMDNSKCSVAVFMDRGLSSPTLLYGGSEHGSNMGGGAKQHFAMLFIGGPDDREGLSYAWRMCGNPKISLTVIRFIPSKDVNVEEIINNSIHFPSEEDYYHNNVDVMSMEKSYNYEMEKKLDDQYLEQLKLKSNNQPSMYVQFIEEIVSNAHEIVKTIGSIENDFDLIIAGRGKGVISPLTIGLLSDWNECPELGPLCDILVTSSLAMNTSILIVQRGQLVGSTYEQDLEGDTIGGQLTSHDGHMTWQVKEAPKVEFAPFINRRARIVDAP